LLVQPLAAILNKPIIIIIIFWCWFTRVVLEKKQLNECSKNVVTVN